MNRAHRARSRTIRGLLSAIALSAVAITFVSGCSALNGSSGSSGSVGNSQVEKSNITIGILKTPDDAPVELAQVDGFYKAVGLNPTIKIFASGPSMYSALANGSLDISLTNYVNYFSAVAQHTLDAKIVADAYAATPDSFVLLVPPNSTIKTPADLQGKKIAIQAAGNINTLLVEELMQTNNLSPTAPVYLPVHFPDMPAALSSGQIDAATELEPYITQMQRSQGAKEPFPLITAATNDMPLSGYIATSKFAKDNPKTIAAFQQALIKANQTITNRKEAAKVLPQLTGVAPNLVPMMNLGAFPTSLDANRLQRVITLMQTFHVLNANLQASDLIVPIKNNSN